MKPFLVRLALTAAVFTAPYLLVMLAGWWWLYERGYFLWWAMSAAVLLLAGRGLRHWTREWRRAASPSGVQASPDWAPESERAWPIVEEFSARVRREQPPLDSLEQCWKLLQELLDSVARCYHPESTAPVLETPVREIAMIVELVAHDLGEAASAAYKYVPGSHAITVREGMRLGGFAPRAYEAYLVFYRFLRWARLANNPLYGLAREVANSMERTMSLDATLDLKDTAIDFIIRRVGKYAIELYSGHVMANDSYFTRRSRADATAATSTEASARTEPLRILIVGQVSAGKSSLVNALFGEIRAATDILPTTRGVTPLVFDREGFGRALIFDTAGYGGARDGIAGATGDPFAELNDELLGCDLILLVCAATSAARASDRSMLDAVREQFQRHSKRRPPPVVVALTHIDLLRPFVEWNPPYNLIRPANEKARRIAAAVESVAEELLVEPELVIPACLSPERMYNVEEGFLPALIQCLPDASRARALRCLGAARDEAHWLRMWRQAVAGGRVLLSKASGR